MFTCHQYPTTIRIAGYFKQATSANSQIISARMSHLAKAILGAREGSDPLGGSLWLALEGTAREPRTVEV
jgi:hypothetical protein